MPNILPDLGFIQPNRARTVARRPKMKSLRVPPSFDEIPVDSYRRFPFQPTNRVRHAEFRRDAQTQVDMVGHRMPFNQLHTKLPAQIFQYPSYLLP